MNIPNQRFSTLDFKFAPGFAAIAHIAVLGLLLIAPSFLAAQTIATGNIAGEVTDPNGKPIAGSRVDIVNRLTTAVIHVSTSAGGWYTSGPIQPGSYSLRIEAKGLNPAHLTFEVHVGNTTTANVRMQKGPEGPVIQIIGGTAVNVTQATTEDVIAQDSMHRFPINGRDLFDFLQLDPGVQIQDGGVLDATKNGTLSVSLLSDFGRNPRISVDGADVNDEVAGGLTQNIPTGAVQEAQVARSVLDLSTPPTNSGAVNLITRSGSDQIHGDVFGLFRGDKGAASLPGTAPQSFSRELFGGRAGGAIIKDKVFWFADAERAKQDLTSPEPFAFPFDGLFASLREPYREFDTDERIDWKMRGSTRAFYRLNFFQDTDVRPFGAASSTQSLSTGNNTLTNLFGVDFTTGPYAHSIRAEYLKLRSSVGDATSPLSGVDNPIPGLGINIAASIRGNCVLSDGGGYCGGPSWLGLQREIQSDKLGRYDGERVFHQHIFRYGLAFNRIDGARMNDLALDPQVGTTSFVGLTSPDPTSYPANYVTLGNGVGFSTPQSAFGLRGGGLGPNNRLQIYGADAFKIEPNVTFSFGVQYLHDSALTDGHLGAQPLLNQWGASYGDQIRNPNLNFAPQAGLVWNVGGAGTTVIHIGAGLVWADPLMNNLAYDTAARLSQGSFLSTPEVCSGGVASPFPWPTNLSGVSSIAGGAATVVNTSTGPQALPSFCGGTISTVAPAILALSSAYQAATAAAAGGANNNFLGSALTALDNRGYDLLYPGYRTPRSWQMNIGVEKAIGTSTRLSLNYIRNVGEHFLIGQDINHSGAARSFNQANAAADRDAAQTSHGCPTGFGEATCMVAALGQAGAQAAYSAAGLDSNLQTTGGGPCSYCAFPGTNPITGNTGAVGGVDMLFPDGRSLYTGYQAKLVHHLGKPVRGIKSADLQVAYTYSKFVSNAQDQDAINLALDNDNPGRFIGPNALDRKQQISFAGTLDLPWYTKLSIVGHFYSPLAQNLLLPELTNGGEIFATDWLGAGLPANGSPEPLPGTQLGQMERGSNIYTLQKAINTYNHTYAGALTPAGACLVANTAPGNPFSCPGIISGPPVMTPTDMTALGWLMPTVGSVAPDFVGIPWLKSMDVKLYWPFHYKDRITIEPSASVFNVFNFWNAYLPGNLPNASLIPGQNGLLAPTAVGGIASGSPSLTPFRANFQSGTFAMGTPRTFEFGLRISF